MNKKFVSALVCLVLTIQLSGCGMILHPERQGQRGGRIDPGIAILDAVGLLFFLLPGVVAFAVDFSTGTIYLPNSRRGSLDIDELKTVKFDKDHFTYGDIEKIIKDRTGVSVKLNQEDMKITRMDSAFEMKMTFARVWPALAHPAAVYGMK